MHLGIRDSKGEIKWSRKTVQETDFRGAGGTIDVSEHAKRRLHPSEPS